MPGARPELLLTADQLGSGGERATPIRALAEDGAGLVWVGTLGQGLLRYDPDQVQLLYVTPHRWTPYFDTVAERRVIEPDVRKWDYKHQVLATSRVPPWRVLLWVKCIEAAMQLRPRALFRNLLHPDPEVRYAMRWYTRMGRRVWPHELWDFLVGRRLRKGPRLDAFWGPSLAEHEYALAKPARRPRSGIARPAIPLATLE